MSENDIATEIVDCAFHIHVAIGPGLMESVYETILHYELEERGLLVNCQVRVPIEWKGVRLNKAYVADMIVEDKVLLELKCVRKLLDEHYMQLLSYLKLTDLKLGLLINFNERLIKHGIKRVVNGL